MGIDDALSRSHEPQPLIFNLLFGTRSKSKSNHGTAIATGHQANLATAELCNSTIVGLGPSVHSPPDSFRHVANAVIDPESGATLDLRLRLSYHSSTSPNRWRCSNKPQ